MDDRKLRDPSSRWCVAKPPSERGTRLRLGMTVWSWHRFRWQAHLEILSGRPYEGDWRVTSAADLDASWACVNDDITKGVTKGMRAE